MPEVALDFPRAWLELPDPADNGQVLRCDLTWLTSRWTCIFGRGCRGIYADRPDDGCCTLGAHFTDQADEDRVRRYAARLDAGVWQQRAEGHRHGVIETDDEGARKTRLVGGACVFLNRPDFAGGPGCALHAYAVREGLHPLQAKPDVCWQLPLRRSYRTVERPDGTTYLEVTIGEYDRRGWGAGGHDLDWYCTGSSEAHVGEQPMYRSCEAARRALVGDAAYEALAEHCRRHLAARPRQPVHPATRLAGRARR